MKIQKKISDGKNHMNSIYYLFLLSMMVFFGLGLSSKASVMASEAEARFSDDLCCDATFSDEDFFVAPAIAVVRTVLGASKMKRNVKVAFALSGIGSLVSTQMTGFEAIHTGLNNNMASDLLKFNKEINESIIHSSSWSLATAITFFNREVHDAMDEQTLITHVFGILNAAKAMSQTLGFTFRVDVQGFLAQADIEENVFGAYPGLAEQIGQGMSSSFGLENSQGATLKSIWLGTWEKGRWVTETDYDENENEIKTTYKELMKFGWPKACRDPDNGDPSRCDPHSIIHGFGERKYTVFIEKGLGPKKSAIYGMKRPSQLKRGGADRDIYNNGIECIAAIKFAEGTSGPFEMTFYSPYDMKRLEDQLKTYDDMTPTKAEIRASYRDYAEGKGGMKPGSRGALKMEARNKDRTRVSKFGKELKALIEKNHKTYSGAETKYLKNKKSISVDPSKSHSLGKGPCDKIFPPDGPDLCQKAGNIAIPKSELANFKKKWAHMFDEKKLRKIREKEGISQFGVERHGGKLYKKPVRDQTMIEELRYLSNRMGIDWTKP